MSSKWISKMFLAKRKIQCYKFILYKAHYCCTLKDLPIFFNITFYLESIIRIIFRLFLGQSLCLFQTIYGSLWGLDLSGIAMFIVYILCMINIVTFWIWLRYILCSIEQTIKRIIYFGYFESTEIYSLIKIYRTWDLTETKLELI